MEDHGRLGQSTQIFVLIGDAMRNNFLFYFLWLKWSSKTPHPIQHHQSYIPVATYSGAAYPYVPITLVVT